MTAAIHTTPSRPRKHRIARAALLSAATGALIATAPAGAAYASPLERVSVADGTGAQGNAQSSEVSISADGRYVAFTSYASVLVAGDDPFTPDVYVRDRQTGTTERVSSGAAGTQADGPSHSPSMSPDGRYVAFVSKATNLQPRLDVNGMFDVYVRDRQTGITHRVSLSSTPVAPNGDSHAPSISPDGRYVAFTSAATNLVAGDTNASRDVFVRDRQKAITERVSVAGISTQGNDASGRPAISADGRYVAFDSDASNLVAGDFNSQDDVFVRDRLTAFTERVSVSSTGTPSNHFSYEPSISADGRHVAFTSAASNLVGDTNGCTDVLVHDRWSSSTTLVSVNSSEVQADSCSMSPSISSDGRHIAFASIASNLFAQHGGFDIYVRDRAAGVTEPISAPSGGQPADDNSDAPSISPDGKHVAFSSGATNLVPGDTNGVRDAFVRDR